MRRPNQSHKLIEIINALDKPAATPELIKNKQAMGIYGNSANLLSVGLSGIWHQQQVSRVPYSNPDHRSARWAYARKDYPGGILNTKKGYGHRKKKSNGHLPAVMKRKAHTVIQEKLISAAPLHELPIQPYDDTLTLLFGHMQITISGRK